MLLGKFVALRRLSVIPGRIFTLPQRLFGNKMAQESGLPMAQIQEWLEEYPNDKSRLIAQKACTQFDPMLVMKDRQKTYAHFFNTKVSTEVKPVTQQNASGRCWIFACLNVMRQHFCKHYNFEEFEFSQSYVFFWDKVERMNFLLGSYMTIALEGADHTDRTLYHLLANPAEDGGQWQMLVNIIEKYGIIPNDQWPSPWLADNSRRLNNMLNNQMRTNCHKFVSMAKEGRTREDMEKERTKMMKSLFDLISTALGSPPKMTQVEFYDKDKKYHKLGPMSPLEFYKTLVKPLFDLEQQVVLTHDPRASSVYGKTYTVAYLNNMDNCKPVTYLNMPVDALKKYAKLSIEDDKSVWFGCDVGKDFSVRLGPMATEQFDYEMVFGIDMRATDKATRLLYKETEMTHAMVLTAANVEEDGVVSKWRVENSWGESKVANGKGYHVLTDGWFDEYVFLVVVDKSLLPTEVTSLLDQKPIMLPAWDPMGALARG